MIGQIAEIANLELAFLKARRGKGGKREVIEFAYDLQENLYGLRQSILQGTAEVGGYNTFHVYDPKKRLICAAPFGQRVLHHAMMNICHEDFERFQTKDSFASRLGRGTYAALEVAYRNQRHYGFWLKMDVRKYFDSIDHRIAQNQISRLYKDRSLLELFEKIIDSYETHPGKGLPIGNLTSQYMANHYLAYADHFIKEKLRAKAYVRYMDDMMVWDDNRERLLEIGKAMRNFLEKELKLELKVFQHHPTTIPVTFLGYTLNKHQLRLSKRSADRYRRRARSLFDLYGLGIMDEEELSSHLVPMTAFIRKAPTRGFENSALNWAIR